MDHRHGFRIVTVAPKEGEITVRIALSAGPCLQLESETDSAAIEKT